MRPCHGAKNQRNIKRMEALMNTRYYFGWFPSFFPELLCRALQEDLIERKSLVMISSNPGDNKIDGATERSWLDHAGIVFDSYTLINYDVSKEEAHRLIQSASVLFLLGGDTLKQHQFIQEYNLKVAVKSSSAVVLSASAGAINLSSRWVASRNLGYDVDETMLMEGIGLDDFAVLSHFDLENRLEMMRHELLPLSQEMPVYASNKDCAVRVKEGHVDILGDVYLLTGPDCKKIEETL